MAAFDPFGPLTPAKLDLLVDGSAFGVASKRRLEFQDSAGHATSPLGLSVAVQSALGLSLTPAEYAFEVRCKKRIINHTAHVSLFLG
jgi:hypothetical protein